MTELSIFGARQAAAAVDSERVRLEEVEPAQLKGVSRPVMFYRAVRKESV